MADSNQQSPGLLANILAVAGFIILIVIIVWGAYHLLRLTGSGVTSLFSKFGGKSDAIALTSPASAQSGKSFPLSWKFTPAENGTYAFLYQCKSGFRFDLATAAGTNAAIPCGNAFTVGANTSLTLLPTLSGTSSIDIPVSVVFMPSATSSSARPQGTATIRVIASTEAAPATTVTPTKPASGTNTGSTGTHVAGPADLAVHIIGVGVVDPYGNFVQRAPMNPNEIAAVKFDIGNNGGASTGVWFFTVQLPTDPMYTYQSPAQMSLAPGAHIENILRFRPMNAGGGQVSVWVDPQNLVRESNESNNNATQWAAAQVWTEYPYQAPYVY